MQWLLSTSSLKICWEPSKQEAIFRNVTGASMAEGEEVKNTASPFGGSLILRHASKRSSGTWGPDDYDVIDSRGRDIGRILKERWRPDGLSWAITAAVVMPHLPSHGNCATLDEAKARFAEAWMHGWAN
jgi:hypothetical protein